MRTDLNHNDFKILESIRGLASLYVLIAHARGILWMGGKMYLEENPIDTWGIGSYLIFGSSMMTRLAVEFVIIFFVLSGFSIAHSMQKSNSTYQFYSKRIIRIYPPYIMAVLWAGVVLLLTYTLQPDFFANKYNYLVFARYSSTLDYLSLLNISKLLLYIPPMQGFVVQFWSLSYEIIFYILSPLIFTVNRRLFYLTSTLLFLYYLIFYKIFKASPPDNILSKYFLIYNFFFFLGIVLYQYYSLLLQALKKINKTILMSICASLLLLTYSINIYFQQETVWSYLSAALLSVALIILFLRHQIKIRWLISVGKYSYTLYITHVASLFLYHSIYHSVAGDNNFPHIKNYLVFMPSIFFSLFIAYLLYIFVEKQTKKRLDKIRHSTG